MATSREEMSVCTRRPLCRRARDQERAANRRAGEHVVSLEVEVGDFGVINPRTTFLLVEETYGS